MAVLLAAPSYRDSIRDWQVQRNEKLRAADSWLSLAGLFWLKTGDNSIGTGKSVDFALPGGSAPSLIGVLTLSRDNVVFKNRAGSAVSVNGQPVSSPVTLSHDEDKPDVVHAGTISFFVIERNGKLAIRAKDSSSPVLRSFAGMKYFPVDPVLHFEAKLIPEKKQISILDITGQREMQDSPGIVEFSHQGVKYHLRPIYEDKTLFFLFKDPTNKTRTYQAGRMLNTPLPVDGKVDLDFNKSYNPPCTFTPYATCPLPPKENTLPFPVRAGELRYGTGHAEYTASR